MKESGLKKTIWRLVNENNKTFLMKFLSQSDAKKQSLKQYEYNIKHFYIWNNIENGDKDIRDVSKEDLYRYFNFLIIDEKLKTNSIKIKRNILATFYSFLVKNFPSDFKENIVLQVNINYDLSDDNDETPTIRKRELEFLEKYLYQNGNLLQLIYLLLSNNNNLTLEQLRHIKRDIVNAKQTKYGDYIYCIKRNDLKKCSYKPRLIYMKEDIMEYIRIYEKSRIDDIDYLFVNEKKDNVDVISTSAFSYWCKEVFSKILNRDIKHSNLYRKNKK